MQTLYVVLLIVVAVAIAALLAGSVFQVTRKPAWERREPRYLLIDIVPDQRRNVSLPFVGQDRRMGEPRVARISEQSDQKAA